MRRRCEMPSQNGYRHYGGRGIRVCPEWRADYSAFLSDMGRAPTPAHTLDRIDPNGHYEPGNCRWASVAEQSLNKRNTVRLEHEGQSLPLAEWAARLGLRYQTLWRRVFVMNMPLERALVSQLRP
jgi:hypothetical protein